MAVDSIFRIASMTKPITSAAALLMQYRPFFDDTAIEALQGFGARV